MGSKRALYLWSMGVFAGSILLAVAVRGEGRWDVALLVTLLVVATVSDFIYFRTKGLRLSGAFLAIVLGAALLGPAQATLIAVLSSVVDTIRVRPKRIWAWNNLATYGAFPLAGGLVMIRLADLTGFAIGDAEFGVIVLVGYFVANAVNFVLVAGAMCWVERTRMRDLVRSVFLPVMPSELAIAILAALMVFAYAHAGLVALAGLVCLLYLYQYLLRELVVSQERSEELQSRTTQLASLQMGVLSAMLQTLSLRDRMTARHSAAVARYAREIAREYGCDEADQELVHTAGLLHDIGKFIFPDRILLANSKLSEEDWETVKRHPAQGAKVVRAIEGYGPVADIILCHHERMDGLGYPRAIAGEDIPLLSRMISIADTYDVMTARDSYREPVSPAEAIAELRRVSGTQLDGQLVELFITVLKRKSVAFRHADDADFEAELSFDKRVREYAQPRTPASSAAG